MAAPAVAGAVQDRYFMSDDGVRLHYLEAGKGQTIVFVPGWTMPAWIFDRQIADFSTRYHVIAFDPRGQGDSDIPPDGYDPDRRGRDIGNLIDHLGGGQVLLAGWSLGVLDALAYVQLSGDARLAGLVLIDNSVGEEPPPPAPQPPARNARKMPKLSREASMRAFVRGMFNHPPPTAYIDRLTAAAMRVPPNAASALLAYPVPRSYWKTAVYSTAKPILYIVRPRLAGQAGNLEAHHPGAESVVLYEVGHALFIDEPARFDAILQDFIRRRIWH